MKLKNTTLICIALLTLNGCLGENKSFTESDRGGFVSLDEKVDFEYGYVEIDGKKTTLSYSGTLLWKDTPDSEFMNTGYTGLFSDTRLEQFVTISTEGESISDENMLISIPNEENGFICEDLTLKESKSKIIKDESNIYITSKACMGSDTNKGLIKDITVKVTQSMFDAGTSRLSIKSSKAYLKTEYQISKNLFVTGGLGRGAYNQIFDLKQFHPKVNTIILEQISGSIDENINMKTGQLIRRYGYTTHLLSSSDIASGGVTLFCAGVKRTMDNGAKVGVHAWSGGEVRADTLPDDSPKHTLTINYFNQMLGEEFGKDFYFFYIHAATPDDIYYMSKPELISYHLLTE